ncbi:MAG: NAD(P)-binding protein [Desulfosoma sp.]
MTKRRRMVVVGGDAAGMSAASVARRMAPHLDIIVFEKGPHTSYSA